MLYLSGPSCSLFGPSCTQVGFLTLAATADGGAYDCCYRQLDFHEQ